MEDFASTALIALVVDAVRAEAPDFAAGRPDPMLGARRPAAEKARLLAEVMERFGPGMLLAVGQRLDLAEDAPALAVLRQSPAPAVIADKWMRLERYHHSDHRTWIGTGPTGWLCERHGEGATPGLAENLLIAGLLFGLVCSAGFRGARLMLGGQDLAADELRNVRLKPGEAAARFGLRWEAEPALAVAAGAGRGRQADRLADLLASDIGRGWRIGDAARMLAVSDRSLQRRLGAEGRTFSSVLRRARIREAARLLARPEVGLAEVGYCCGYADQAHFQRDFRRAANLTPGAYRKIAMTGKIGAMIQ